MKPSLPSLRDFFIEKTFKIGMSMIALIIRLHIFQFSIDLKNQTK
jgi:hypothetical protein